MVAYYTTNNSNYASADSVPVAFTISPAPLTITADNKSKAYGAALPSLTASYSGFVGAETSANLTTLPTLTTTATAASHVSGNPYTITASAAADTDYTISYVNGTLNITPATLTVTGVTANDKVYDGTTAASLNVSNAALVGVFSGDLVTLDSNGATGTFASPNVGDDILVTISGLTLGGAQATDYSLTQPTTTADIAPLFMVLSSAPTTVGPTNAESLTFTIVFSEAVSNVTTDDFRLTSTGTATGTIASVDASSGTTFNVVVDAIGGDGTLRLDLKNGTDVEDAAGNGAPGYMGGTAVIVDNAPPTITHIWIALTAWSTDFLGSLGGIGYGISDGPNQLLPLAGGNLNRIIVQFSENVSVQQGDLTLTGVNVPSYSFTAFSYDATNNRATWTVNRSLPADRLTITLDGSTAGAVTDVAGNRLDGNWTNPTWSPPAAPPAATRGPRATARREATSISASTFCRAMSTRTARLMSLTWPYWRPIIGKATPVGPMPTSTATAR